MSAPIGYVAAFGGGLVSFASPCVLPLVPAYLSVITGLDLTELQERSRRQLWRIARDTLSFAAGFSVVFVGLGMSATAVGSTLADHHGALTRISGLVVLAMGLFVLASLVVKAPWMYRELRFHPQLRRYGRWTAPVAGAAFAFGWTPCLGPVLGAVLAVAAGSADPWHGALLLLAYSAGLAVPFLLTGLAFARAAGALGLVRRHLLAVTVTAALSLSGFGVLLTLNRLTLLTSALQAGLRHTGLDGLITLG